MSILKPSKIILHCSDTPDSDSCSFDAIKRYHIEHNRWSNIGYHYVIEQIDSNVTLLYGRKPYVIGAHCKAKGRNHDSIGVCVVGKFDKKPPVQQIFDYTCLFIAELCTVFDICPTQVYGHCEFDNKKTCPGKMWDLEKTRKKIDEIQRSGI